MNTMRIPEDETWDPFLLSNDESVGDSIFDDDSWKDPFGSNNNQGGSDVDSFGFGFGDGDTAVSWSSFQNVSDGSASRAAAKVQVVDWPSPQGAESEKVTPPSSPKVGKPRNASPKVSRAREIIQQRNQRRQNFSSGRATHLSAAAEAHTSSSANQQSSNIKQPLDPEPSIPLDESMDESPATPRKSNTRKQLPTLSTQKQQMEPPAPKASNASSTINNQQQKQTTIQRQSEPPQIIPTKYKSLDNWYTRQQMMQQKRIQKHWDEATINTANSVLTDEMTHDQRMKRRQKQSTKQVNSSLQQARAGEQSMTEESDPKSKFQLQQKTQDVSIFSRNDLVFSQFTRLRRSQQQNNQVGGAVSGNENQTSSLSSRRLLWGGQLLQEPIQEEEAVSTDIIEEKNELEVSEEKKLEEPEDQNQGHARHVQQPLDEADETRGGISMEKLLAESAIQEATWTNSKPTTHVEGKQSPAVRWPPYSSPKPPVVTPSPPKETYQRKDLSQQPGAIAGVGNGVAIEQSPTRSDHSADAAAGAYLNKLRSISTNKSMDPPANNDDGEESNPASVDSPERSNLAPRGKKYVRSVLETKGLEPSGQPSAMSTAETSVNHDGEQGISRKVSWEDDNSHSHKVNLEAKLSQISKHHKRVDSSNRSIGNISAGHVSIQPSVESECVHQNREMFDMMDNMMNFFTTTENDDGEEYDVDEILDEGTFDMSEERKDDGDYYPSSPGSCCGPEEDTILFDVDAGKLEALAEEIDEVGGTSITPTSYCSDDVLGVVAANYYLEVQPEYTSMKQLALPPDSPEDEQVQDANTTSAQAKSEKLPNQLLVPVSSEEYDDPSLFNNSLMSDSSSELTPALAASAPMAKENSNRALQVANKNKDLNAFLDKFGDHILRGCQDGVRGDADSSDVFVANNSQFGNNSQAGDDVNLPSSPTSPSEKIYDGRGVILNQAVPLLRATTQIGPISKIDEDSISEEEDPIVDKPQLPPASTFLSAKERAKIRQYDTTPLRTNTSRARRFRRHYKPYSETQSMEPIKEDGDVDESSRSLPKQGQKDEQAILASSTMPEGKNDESLTEVKHIVPIEARNLDPPADENNSPKNNAPQHDGEFTNIMSYREVRKGHSLAWHSSNGVNDDEVYDAGKSMPPSRANDRAANLAKRLNLFSITSHNATTFQDHFDSPQQEGLSLLYTQNNTSNDCNDGDHLLEESYSSDNEEDDASTSDDDRAYDRRDDECSAHDDVVRDFQDLMSKVESFGKSSPAFHEKLNEDELHGGQQEIISPGSKLLSLEEMIANESAANKHSSQLVEMRQKVQQNTPSDASKEVPIRYQMQPNNSASLAQRKALYLSGGSRTARHNRGPPRPLRQIQSSGSSSSSNNNTTQPHHPHHVPKHQEVSKSRLEEQLRGIANRDSGGRDAMKQSSGTCSVGTSELGSLFTRASDKSHFGALPVPLTIFHRTHPRPLIAGDTESARSSPSSMQNTYFDPSVGVGVIARNSQTGGITPRTPEDLNVDGWPAMDIANHVNILPPDPDEDVAFMQCHPPSTTKVPAARGAKQINNAHNSQKMYVQESSRKAAAAAIAKIDEELLRSKAKTTGIGVDVFPAPHPTRAQKSSKAAPGKPKSYLANSHLAPVQNDTNPHQKFPRQKAMIARNDSNRAISNAASAMVMSGLNQRRRHVRPNAAQPKLSSSNNPLNGSVHVQRRLDSNEKTGGLPVSSPDTSSLVKNAPRQIPKSFNTKSINARNQKAGIIDDNTSQQSSIFEAFEIAPILTTIANKSNGNSVRHDTSFLHDLGVHHHLRHKRDTKKKVGFPEAVAQRHQAMPQGRFLSENFEEAGFEVMLQSRKGNNGKASVPSNNRSPKSAPTDNQRVARTIRPQQPMHNTETGIGSHRDKIKQRIRLGWKRSQFGLGSEKKMTTTAPPRPNKAATVSQRTAKPAGGGPNQLPGSRVNTITHSSGQWVAKTDANGKIQFTQTV